MEADRSFGEAVVKVFWSWQNDVTPKQNRDFIRNALAEAVERVGDELGLEDADRPELDHDTKQTPGMADIAATILEKISRSAVFVADMTPIGESPGGKALPNPNVLIELGWALSKVGVDRTIGVLNTAHGYKPDDLPFDIRNRRTLLYHLAADADKATQRIVRQKLTTDLTEALRINLGQYADDQAVAHTIEGVAANPDDPSIWSSASGKLQHYDSIQGAIVSRTLPSCPRAYIRIIPAGWRGRMPSVNQIENMPPFEAVQAPSEGSRDGDFGVCEEGYARYWLTGQSSHNEFETRNVAMWFDKTGEFWVIHGTAIFEAKGRTSLHVQGLVRGWRNSLRQAMALYDRMGASPSRKVEAGLAGVRGVLWPGQLSYSSPPARKDKCAHVVQRRDWNEEAQLEFLTDAYNEVRDLFGHPHVEQRDVLALVR
jgi:hypothetical protein